MINDVIQEFRLVANAHSNINDFTFNEFSAVDWEDRSKGYPVLLVQAQGVPWTSSELNASFLARKKCYQIDLFLHDTYHEAEKATTAREIKMGEVELYLDQFLAELANRAESGVSPGYIKSTEGTQGMLSYDTHANKLVTATAKFKYIIDTNCDAGIFNY